jgi:hypothetical protein
VLAKMSADGGPFAVGGETAQSEHGVRGVHPLVKKAVRVRSWPIAIRPTAVR